MARGSTLSPSVQEIRRLPSQDAAIHLVDGVPGAWIEILATTGVRTAIIAAGMRAAGFKGPGLWARAIAGAIAVEVVVVGFVGYERVRARQ